MAKKKIKIIKKKKAKKIGLLLNNIYDNFKKKQKSNEKKEIKLKQEQIKKDNEKLRLSLIHI